MATRTSPRLQSRSAKPNLPVAKVVNHADHVKALKAQLSHVKALVKKEAEHWEVEQARLLQEHEEWVRKEDQAIAKLRAENEGLAAQLMHTRGPAEPSVHDEPGGGSQPPAAAERERSRSTTPSTDTDIPETPPKRQRRSRKRKSQFAGRPDDEVEEKYEVEIRTVKQEEKDGPLIEEFHKVTLSKSEDGSMLWDLNALGLGPVGDVGGVYQRSFERKVVSWAFGGGHIRTHHNHSTTNLDPYATYHPKWNPQLPGRAGAHGIAFSHAVDDELLPVFVRVKSNQWRYCGHYATNMYGDLDSTQLARVPRSCLVAIARDYIEKKWGQEYLSEVNDDLKEEALAQGKPYRPVQSTEQSICAAFLDGRLTMNFTVLEFSRYEHSWFQRLLDAEAAGHRIAPKPKYLPKPKEPKTKADPDAKPKAKKRSKKGSTADAQPAAKKRKAASGKAVRAQEQQAKGQNDADSDIEIVGVKEAPKRQLRSSRRAVNLAWLESDGKESDDGGDGGDYDDFDEENDEA
ncbi:uncharacterized protein SCHCODRAFT_02619894 [Schizophyllum commune H4-8]|uniref:DUF6697 domain-containing protein n=1 Tax=Schizophyllum commune (strain H4-8 / FGSC 9210) TaxID=578458 RepID=D8Q1X1_SCHCM|nr:uncharacterized protein SCHCODRAFT_02619894 [Schizophyllum commune H4-8]KAI5895605.1 hypothetical protein SCHCODRAFT_02619894 [Schizophyllum commune H4-8]